MSTKQHDKDEDARHRDEALQHKEHAKPDRAKDEQHAVNQGPRTDGGMDSINEPPGSNVAPPAPHKDDVKSINEPHRKAEVHDTKHK